MVATFGVCKDFFYVFEKFVMLTKTALLDQIEKTAVLRNIVSI